MITKSNFEEIADIIYDLRPNKYAHNMSVAEQIQDGTLNRVAIELAKYFEKENLMFNPSKFFERCGNPYEDKTEPRQQID